VAALHGKRRSFSQRVGTKGENEFRNFADRQGLIATKVDEDFGTDFFCEIDLDHDSNASSAVGHTIVSVCVRASSGKDGRIRLKKNDAFSLLRARGCMMLTLIHVNFDKRESNKVYFRFVDEVLSLKLRKFLKNESKMTLSLTPIELYSEEEFRSRLAISTQPGYLEEVAVRVAESGISDDIADVNVDVHRSSAGSFTAVTTFNFYDLFERLNEESRQQLYEATFGIPLAQQKRIAKLAIRSNVIDSLEKLPHPYVIGGLTTTEDVELRLTNDHTSARCKFIHTENGEHYGWVHSAGAALTVSKSKLVGGRWIHEMAAFFDPLIKTDFSDDPELTKFLQSATTDAELSDDGNYAFQANYFHKLINGGEMARAWESAKLLTGWRSGIVHLRDIGDFETHTTMAFLKELADNPDTLSGFSFILDHSIKEAEGMDIKKFIAKFSTHETLITFPIVANTKNVTVLAEVHCSGEVYTRGAQPESVAGVKVKRINDVCLSIMPLITKGTVYPEVIVAPAITTIPLGVPVQERPDRVRVPDELSSLQMEFSPIIQADQT
jgi:hypothetical protein